MGSAEGPPKDLILEAPFSNSSSQSDSSSVTLSVNNSQQSSCYEDSVFNSSIQNVVNFSDSSLDDCYRHDDSSLIEEEESRFETWTDSFVDSDSSTNSSDASLVTMGMENQESSEDGVPVENQLIATDDEKNSLISNKASKLTYKFYNYIMVITIKVFF